MVVNMVVHTLLHMVVTTPVDMVVDIWLYIPPKTGDEQNLLGGSPLVSRL